MNLTHLAEALIKDLKLSNITQKSYNDLINSGNAGVKLVNVQIKPNELHLSFEVNSSTLNATQTSPNGQMFSKGSAYDVQVHFTNTNKYVPQNFLQMPYSQQKNILASVFKNCDVQVDCSCPGWYWQGQQEKSSKRPPDLAFYGFRGTPGTDIWARRHKNSKGLKVCKHIWEVVSTLNQYIPDMLKILGKGISGSMAVSTQQPFAKPQDASLAPPEALAGTPVKKAGTKASTKASANVSANVSARSNAKSNAKSNVKSTQETPANGEQADANISNELTDEESLGEVPSGNITKVNAKKIQGKTSASKGPMKTEPAIPEPELSEEKMNDSLDEPLESKNNGPLNESLRKSLRKPLHESSSHGNIFGSALWTVPKHRLDYIAPTCAGSYNCEIFEFIHDSVNIDPEWAVCSHIYDIKRSENDFDVCKPVGPGVILEFFEPRITKYLKVYYKLRVHSGEQDYIYIMIQRPDKKKGFDTTFNDIFRKVDFKFTEYKKSKLLNDWCKKSKNTLIPFHESPFLFRPLSNWKHIVPAPTDENDEDPGRFLQAKFNRDLAPVTSSYVPLHSTTPVTPKKHRGPSWVTNEMDDDEIDAAIEIEDYLSGKHIDKQLKLAETFENIFKAALKSY